MNHLVLNLRSYTPSSSSSHARPHRTRPRGRRSINGVRSILGSHSLSDIRFRSGSGEGEGAGGGFGGRGKTLSLSLSLGNIGAPLDFFGRGEGEDADADVDMGVEADSDSRFIEVEGGGEGDGAGDGGVVVRDGVSPVLYRFWFFLKMDITLFRSLRTRTSPMKGSRWSHSEKRSFFTN